MFRKNIEPRCDYCKLGTVLSDGNVICKKFGLVEPVVDCKKFEYSSLKRVPRRRPTLPEFDQSDFSID